WCYFIWYLVVLVRYFEADLQLWGTSFGLCFIIGFALYLNATRSGKERYRLPFWPAFRLFMMPLCVSSFSALVKGKGFFLIFSPNADKILIAVGLCAVLCGTVTVLKRRRPATDVATPR